MKTRSLEELEAQQHVSDNDDDDDTSSGGSSDDDDDGGDEVEDAEDLNRRLEKQLWEEITKAKALEATTGTPVVEENPPEPPPPAPIDPPAVPRPDPALILQKRQDAVVFTINAIMSLLERDPTAHSTLASTAITPPESGNVLDALKDVLSAGSVSKERAACLTQSLVALARSEALFGKLRNSNAPSIQLDLGKRKRGQSEEPTTSQQQRKRRAITTTLDLYSVICDAVRTVSDALQKTPTKGPDPSLISSIQLSLHQIFLFAVTSSSRGGPENNHLQEISGLIQVLGVLSGIPIGQIPPTEPDKQGPQDAFTAWSNPDIGTAVYPCTVTGCTKTFSRLFSLRTHQRVHSSQRPYTCSLCPASFVRNHDLKRHTRLHEKKVWKCSGCNKVFSRRDASKRHRNAAQSRGLKGEACTRAEPIQVEAEHSDEDDVERRGEKLVRLWSDTGGVAEGELEEGEVPFDVLHNTQSAVLHLHYLLQTHVANVSGNAFLPAISVPVDPTAGQATLASVIARAQSQGSTPPNSLAAAPEEPTAPLAPADTAATRTDEAQASADKPPIPSLSLYGLSAEQAKMLEDAITNAALAAQAQAEAEAALEEQDSDDDSENDSDSSDDEKDAGESMVPAQ
ncbi:transcriptional regulator prz1 [Moniliophthora roreri MCA 2997]|uniref:Transcriptional regulator prz1 n=2 Tax=Moniliophthora roreri TaxID=221103 RepID=V2XEE4_MONRO|nr:transcriptional regulator prz1 [Moniliophthora roreri MCA 2997]KAI3604500.1 transcriptional regulator prz1 [Moniliophthora roreri]